ncbi:MAG: sensor domain-containing protein, partial [Candidatus Cloacimonetes bacterium]|nr:sensor domain-containing protein [Candidatus Cloacimonadota bacterium]
MYKSIDEFLSVLKRELKGNDRALIQDALSDAEEHIRTALENIMNTKQEITEEEALSQAIESYGDPSEIAADYKKLDEYLTPMLAPSDKVDRRPWWKKFLLIIADPRAWGASLYMLISILTGIIYHTWAVCGLSVSLPLLIFIIGLPLAGFFLLSVRGIALLEGRIVEALLGMRMPRKPMFMSKDKGWWGKFKALVSSGITWKALVYMLLQMPLGIFYFTLIITLFAVSLSFIAAPILELVFHLPMEINGTDAYTHKWLLPLLPVAGALL